MPDETERHAFQLWEDGETNWEHRSDFELLDQLVTKRGPIAERPAEGSADNVLYHAVDQRIVYRWDDGQGSWEPVYGLGSSAASVGTIHVDDVVNEAELPGDNAVSHRTFVGSTDPALFGVGIREGDRWIFTG